MAIKPILFNTPMALAVRNGIKTETRRLINPRYRDDEYSFQIITNAHTGEFVRVEMIDEWENCTRFLPPQYLPGDILYVRETWRIQSAHRFEADTKIEFRSGGPMSKIQFDGRCSDGHERRSYDDFISRWGVSGNWHPSIFMPKEAARTFVKVTNVWAERLQDITDEQCIREGIQKWSKDGKLYKYAPADGEGDYPMWPWQDAPIAPRGAFVKLWDSTVPKSKLPQCGFAANPWVWVYRFERCANPFVEKEETGNG